MRSVPQQLRQQLSQMKQQKQRMAQQKLRQRKKNKIKSRGFTYTATESTGKVLWCFPLLMDQ